MKKLLLILPRFLLLSVLLISPFLFPVVSHADSAPSRVIRLFEGSRIKLVSGKIRIYGKTVSAAAPFACGDNLVVAHTAGTVAPVTKSVTYGTVTSSLSGASKCWITQNLGADNQAGSATDSTEPSAGWYWQFNRKQGYKHDGTTRTPSTAWIISINESSDWTSANDPCTIELGAGWRLPTSTEWTNADTNGAWNNYTDTYNSVLKLHAAGDLDFNSGALFNIGTVGVLWGSTQFGNFNGIGLYLGSGLSAMIDFSKAYGFSVRCIKD